jgi:hypothetical protein
MIGEGGSRAFQTWVNTEASEAWYRLLVLFLDGYAWEPRRALQMERVICLQRALGKPANGP